MASGLAAALPWDPGPYWLVRWGLQRGLALTYLLAFLVALRQFRPLAGEDGLLPLARYRDRAAFRDRPSLFHLVPSDRAIAWAARAGVLLSGLALVGLPGWLLGTPATMAVWAAMWLLYLSFVNAGQVFYGYGWESMLLESGFLAIWLGGPEVAAPLLVVWLFRWVLFRNMLGSGLIKLRGDDCWRDFTCLDYHYETQPMPNPVSWYAHHFPPAVHRLGVVVNHVAELALPFLYVAPQPVAAVAGALTIAFQGWLLLTGNFSWLNWLTVVLALSTFDDAVIEALLPVVSPAVAATPVPLLLAVVAVGIVVGVLSYYPVANLLSPRQAMNRGWDPLHLVNTYGAFGSITRTRFELVIQGTRDPEPTADADWRTYTVPGKPTDPDRRPPQVAPYHLRLDWQLWFAAMDRSPRRHPWIRSLLAGLLDGDEGVRSLLRTDPFDGEPPRHVRIRRYRYAFTDPETRATTGRWWDREPVGTYYGPVSLDDRRFRRSLDRLGLRPPGDGE